VKLAEQVHEMFDAAAQPVEFPYDQRVTFAERFLCLASPGLSDLLPLVLSAKTFLQPAFARASVCSSRF